jgi:alkylated DNA repair dioxygenase AlkB
MYQATLLDPPHGDGPRVILEERGLVTYEPRFLAPDEADTLLRSLLCDVPWKQEHLRIYGRDLPFPRLTAWYGEPGAVYTYSGVANRPLPWIPALAGLRARLQQVIASPFNSVLLNLYRTGCDGMGWHADDEPELGPRPTIASVSVGAGRRFELRSRETREVRRIELEHGSLLVMRGDCQHGWEHRVPKQLSVRASRINLTFRAVETAGYLR